MEIYQSVKPIATSWKLPNCCKGKYFYCVEAEVIPYNNFKASAMIVPWHNLLVDMGL